MTIQGEKIRLLQWLRQTLIAGARLSDRFETHAAAQELDRELETYLSQLNSNEGHGLAANFATQKPGNTEAHE